MSQISKFGAVPDPSLQLSTSSAKAKETSKPAFVSARVTDLADTSPMQGQLSRLSSVLSSLQKNASSVRSQYTDALNKVKSGTYQVDSLGVSRSIVSDLLTNS